MPILRPLLCLVALLSHSAASHAQDRLFVAGSELGTNGRFGERLSDDPDVAGEPIAGGRFRLISSLRGIEVVDARTGQRYRLPLQPLTTLVTADPVRARVFSRSAGGPVVAIEVTGTQQPMFAPPSSALVSMQYAYAAEQLFINVNRGSPVSPDEALVVIDTRSGSVVRTFDPWPATSVWMVTPDGRRVYYSTAGGQTMAAFDVVGGTTVRAAAVGPLLDMVLDEAGRRLIVRHRDVLPATTVTVFDLDLNRIASTTLGGCARINVSAHTGRVYVVDEVPDGFGVAERLTVLESNGALRNSRVVGRYSRPVCYPVTLVTAPGPPRDVQATVTGRDVTLSWTNVGAASAFVLDVGLAPGRTDASLFLGPDSHTTFTGVPPGAYYLRLRGANEFGGGRASEDLRVVVP